MKLLGIRFLGLAGTGALVTFLVGCGHFHGSRPTAEQVLKNSHNREVVISPQKPGSSSPCEVNFPVTLLRTSKKHTIAWVAEDYDYWVKFVAQSPIGEITVKVPKDKMAGPFQVPVQPDYYFMYAIYDMDPDANPQAKPCKTADDDRDTGLNVKR